MYRAIALRTPGIADLDFSKVGQSWSTDYRFAFSYHADDEPYHIRLEAEIKESDVDWDATIIAHLDEEFRHEHELVVKKGAKIKLVSYAEIEGDRYRVPKPYKPVKVNKMVTASEQDLAPGLGELRIEESNTMYFAYLGDTNVATASLSDDGTYLVSMHVEPKYRRRGIATALYTFIEQHIGHALRPSPSHQTEDAKKFWESRAKRASKNDGLASYTFEQFLQDTGGVAGLVDDVERGNWDYFEGLVAEDGGTRESQATGYFTSLFNSLKTGYLAVTFPHKVYRMVAIDSIDHLRTEAIGIYWAWNEEHAQVYWRRQGENPVDTLLEATITSDDVDWYSTIKANLDVSTGEVENEATLKEHRPLTIERYAVRNGNGAWEWTSLSVKGKTAAAIPTTVYHGTDADFDEIKPGPEGLIWFSTDRNFATAWGKRIIAAKISMSRPYVYEDGGLHMSELDDPKVVKRLAKKYDGIVVKNPSNPKLPTNYAVFSPSQVQVEDNGKTAAAYPLASRDEWYANCNYKDGGGRMVQMSPDAFLAAVRPLKMDDTSRENIDDLKQHIQGGGTLDPLTIYADGKEDGRHRAYAAKELGIKSVPVLDFRQPGA